MITDARNLTVRVDRFGQVQLVDTSVYRYFPSGPIEADADDVYVVSQAVAS